jgi:hypothetical protein
MTVIRTTRTRRDRAKGPSSWYEVSAFGLLAMLVGGGCQNVTPAPPRPDSSGDVVGARRPPRPAPEVLPSPPFPAAPEGPAPIGFSWETIHHQRVSARVLVPSGWLIERKFDAQYVGFVRLQGDEEAVDIEYNGGAGSAERGLLAKPPRPPDEGAAIKRVENEGPAVAVDYVTGKPPRRIIESFARGLSCKARPFRGRTLATESFAICASLRPAGPGALQRRADLAPLLTAAPEHAVIEMRSDATILSMGSLQVMVSPTHFDTMGLLADQKIAGPHERNVEVTIRQRPEGPVYLRRSVRMIGAKDTWDHLGVTVVKSGRECLAHFNPFVRPPTAAEIDYGIAMCDALLESADPH